MDYTSDRFLRVGLILGDWDCVLEMALENPFRQILENGIDSWGVTHEIGIDYWRLGLLVDGST